MYLLDFIYLNFIFCVDINECVVSLCSNGFKCIDLINDFVCEC